MRLAPEGIPFVVGGLLLGSVLAHAARSLQSWAAAAGPVLMTLAALAAAFGLFSLWFFRDPLPAPVGEADAVVAPAEGRVIEIVRMPEPTFIGGEAVRVSIFLSVFNVHVQRAPARGTVALKDYHPGLYLAAWEPKASEANERATLGFETERGRLLVRQIAGLVARRIVTDPVVGEGVERSARIGLIRFGSRVDLFLPADWPVLVEVGTRVRAGETVVARMPAPAA
ncbi:MAG: phosphatidylserine decarboxylase [Gemmatimonadota bacterium]